MQLNFVDLLRICAGRAERQICCSVQSPEACGVAFEGRRFTLCHLKSSLKRVHVLKYLVCPFGALRI